MRAFAYQWKQQTWQNRVSEYSGKPMPYCASAKFAGAGLVPGDVLYVLGLAAAREHLLLIGRFEVASKRDLLGEGAPSEALLSETEARAVLGDEVYGVPLWSAPYYVIPRPGTVSLMSFDRSVPLDPPLMFGKPGAQPRQLFRDPDGRVNQQAIRTVARLRASAVAAFDAVLAA